MPFYAVPLAEGEDEVAGARLLLTLTRPTIWFASDSFLSASLGNLAAEGAGASVSSLKSTLASMSLADLKEKKAVNLVFSSHQGDGKAMAVEKLTVQNGVHFFFSPDEVSQ